MTHVYRANKLLLLILGITGLSGCAVGPDFKTPAAPTVSTYIHRENDKLVSVSHQQFVKGLAVTPQWWKTFDCKKLDELVDVALANNPNLSAAQATLRQAEQVYAAQSGSTQFPTVGAKLSASRNKINPAAFGQKGKGAVFNLYNVGLAVNYDLDVFGGNRRALEALAAKANYQHYQLAAARLTVASNVVITTFTQAQLAEQLSASEEILQAQQHQLDIARKRFALGAIAKMALLSLQTQVEQTRATLPVLRNKLEQTNHLLATLLGQAPAAVMLPHFELADFRLPRKLPLVIPSALIRKRPDIQASMALLHVATAQYDVAVSNLYPQINLSASIGSQALTTSALFGPGSVIWSVAGQLAQPLFNAGLHAGANAAEANLQAAGANYKQTVLKALRNVADVLQQLDNDASVLTAQQAADASSQEALKLVSHQYELGAASYLQLLTAQQQAQKVRINLIAAETARLVDTAALYQAMGGGVLTRPNVSKAITGSENKQSDHAVGSAATTQGSN